MRDWGAERPVNKARGPLPARIGPAPAMPQLVDYEPCVLTSTTVLTGCQESDVCVDGSVLRVAFELDSGEHARRVALGLGAVGSTGLLHALWLVPPGIPVPIAALPQRKRERLVAAPGWVRVDRDAFWSDYAPPAQVRGVGVIGADPQRVIRRAAAQPRVFQRMAVVRGDAELIRSRDIDIASRVGVGLCAVGAGEAKVLVDAPPAELGVPGVFRWWLAELAYRSWLQDRTHPVS